MKKILTIFAVATVGMMAACSSGDDTYIIDGDPDKGTIVLNSRFEGITPLETRVELLDDMTLSLTASDGSVQSLAWPSDNTLRNLAPDTYNIAATTHTDGMPAAGFGNAYLVGEAVAPVTVEKGRTTAANIDYSQLNGGVFFEYSSEILAMDVKLTVTDSDDAEIEYNDHTTETAYFAPGEVVMTATMDGNPATINEEYSRALTVVAGRNWKIKMECSEVGPHGSMNFSVSFTEVTTENIPIEIEEGDGVIELTDINYAFYYGGSSPGYSSFELSLVNYGSKENPSLRDYLRLEGYTTGQKFDGFDLVEGIYTVQAADYMTSTPGLLCRSYPNSNGTAYLGTYAALHSATEEVALYHPSTGDIMSVSYDGETMRLEAQFDGRRYLYIGPRIAWTNRGAMERPAEIEWREVPASGSYSISGTKNLFGGAPDVITGTFVKHTSSVRRLELTGWAGTNGGIFTSYPIYLAYDATYKAFYLDQTTLVSGDGTYYAKNARAVTSGQTLVPASFRFWVPIDFDAGTMDFAYCTYSGLELYVGIYATGNYDTVSIITDFIRGEATLTID